MKESIHIGSIIRDKLKEDGRAASWLAKKLNCNRTNIYKIFDKSDINTDQLLMISKILDHDFFSYYSKRLNNEPNGEDNNIKHFH
ncbi:MAG: XRE family transcriptional regulator [Bacteroidales bacterium]|jgi:plasmid maintenance system antidote protein VapI|nr:XRE family transcriptional regulator [Bacteroidales bacterium]